MIFELGLDLVLWGSLGGWWVGVVFFGGVVEMWELLELLFDIIFWEVEEFGLREIEMEFRGGVRKGVR